MKRQLIVPVLDAALRPDSTRPRLDQQEHLPFNPPISATRDYVDGSGNNCGFRALALALGRDQREHATYRRQVADVLLTPQGRSREEDLLNDGETIESWWQRMNEPGVPGEATEDDMMDETARRLIGKLLCPIVVLAQDGDSHFWDVHGSSQEELASNEHIGLSLRGIHFELLVPETVCQN